MDKYCDIIDIENYSLTEITSDFEPNVEKWIKAVTLFMDGLANRKLVAPAIGSGEDYESKYYDGNSKDYLIIDDCQEIDEIKIGNEWGDNLTITADYITFPKVAPFRRVVLKSTTFQEGIQNVEITGRFGYFNAIPQDLRMACAILVAGIINNEYKGNEAKNSESIGSYSVSYSTEKGIADYKNAIAIIEKYKKYEF